MEITPRSNPIGLIINNYSKNGTTRSRDTYNQHQKTTWVVSFVNDDREKVNQEQEKLNKKRIPVQTDNSSQLPKYTPSIDGKRVCGSYIFSGRARQKGNNYPCHDPNTVKYIQSSGRSVFIK